jgi:hypothetical protein
LRPWRIGGQTRFRRVGPRSELWLDHDQDAGQPFPVLDPTAGATDSRHQCVAMCHPALSLESSRFSSSNTTWERLAQPTHAGQAISVVTYSCSRPKCLAMEAVIAALAVPARLAGRTPASTIASVAERSTSE